MAYTSDEGRRRVLTALGEASEDIARALTALGEAHEQLDEQTAEKLEGALFRPVQRAYALAQRTRADFAARAGLPVGETLDQTRGAPSRGARVFLEDALQAIGVADTELAELQDSMLPVEVGDPQLRAGLSSVRELLSSAGPPGRELLRTLGR